MLIVQRGKELGYRLSDEQFKSVLEEHQERKQDGESEEQFQSALKAENMTLADLGRNLERQMIQVARPAERSARQDWRHRRRGAKRYYESHMNEFTRRADRDAARRS